MLSCLRFDVPYIILDEIPWTLFWYSSLMSKDTPDEISFA
jgi:hypothetical protein